jgi:hypothetical protein
MLASRLQAARQSRFVGREAEKALFRSALNAPEPPFFVLHVYGPGGIGKTSLLLQFAAISKEEDVIPIYLDVRSVEPTTEAVVEAFNVAVCGRGDTPFLDYIESDRRYVLLIDTYETLATLDDWFRDTFLPTLPENMLVILAGRTPLGSAWRTDPGWQALTQSVPLRNLDPNDSRAYLHGRRVPEDQVSSVLRFTHGHPLALSLVADVFAQRQDMSFTAATAPPDVVRTLLEQFVQKVSDPLQRAALEVCPLLRLTTETLLRKLLDIEDARPIFEWLQNLSFMELSNEGLFPHDLAREALLADLRWRNPEGYAELHRRARLHYVGLLNETTGMAQQRILADLIFLHRDNPVVQHMYEWKIEGSFIADRLYNEDIPFLKEIVSGHEGAESARIAEYWMQQQPEASLLIRDRARQPLGFVMMLDLMRISPQQEAADHAVAKIMAFLRQQPPMRGGETATFFRFWMATDTYQDVSPIQSMIFIHIVRHYISKPGLTYTFMTCADPEFWAPGFAYAEIKRAEALDFEIGGRQVGVYAHDWRTMPPAAWLEMLGERELATFTPGVAPVQVEQLFVLGEIEFANALQSALKDYTRLDALRGNPLLRSRLVIDKAGIGAGETERIQALRGLIKTAAETLQSSPRQNKFYRPLYHTYIQPAETQEQAAELLDLPFSTYRRHLKSGIERVTELLWIQELGGDFSRN